MSKDSLFDPNADYSGAIPAGVYVVQLTSPEKKMSAKGNDYISVQWKIQSGEFKGLTIYDNVVLVKAMYQRLAELCLAVGIKKSFKAGDGPLVDQLFPLLKGVMCKVSTLVQEYEGREQPRIDRYIPLTSEEKKKLDDELEVMGGSDVDDDDDIPFD